VFGAERLQPGRVDQLAKCYSLWRNEESISLRTVRVPGRIRLLIVSMITINGINMVGVPCGTNCSTKRDNVIIIRSRCSLTGKCYHRNCRTQTTNKLFNYRVLRQ